MAWKGFSRAHFILCSTNRCKISPQCAILIEVCLIREGSPSGYSCWTISHSYIRFSVYNFQVEKYTQMSDRGKRGVTYCRWFPLHSAAGPLHGRRQRTQTLDSVSRGSGHPEPQLCCLPGLSFLQPLLRTETSTWSGTGARYRGREPMTPGNWCRWHLW